FGSRSERKTESPKTTPGSSPGARTRPRQPSTRSSSVWQVAAAPSRKASLTRAVRVFWSTPNPMQRTKTQPSRIQAPPRRVPCDGRSDLEVYESLTLSTEDPEQHRHSTDHRTLGEAWALEPPRFEIESSADGMTENADAEREACSEGERATHGAPRAESIED